MSGFSGQNRPAPSLGGADPRNRRPLPPQQTLAGPMIVDAQGRLTVDPQWAGWEAVARPQPEYWRSLMMMGA